MTATVLGIPLSALLGGLLIGLGAVGLYLSIGRIAGISGILFGLFGADRGLWRGLFLLGLMGGAALTALLQPEAVSISRPHPGVPLLIVAGLIVGWGTRLGSGCTSGHGVCGISRLSPRSFAAVLAFMVAGMFVASAGRHWLGVA